MGYKTLILSALPVISGAYWYFCAYTALFFAIPWLNKMIRACTDQELNKMCGGIFILFSVLTALFSPDLFTLSNGYSFIWLALLYCIGAWLKRNRIPEKISSFKALIGLVLCIGVTWGCYFFIPNGSRLLNYISPTILLVALLLVCIFSKIRVGKRAAKFIGCFAPAAFGVYLIHVQPCVWEHFMSGAFVWITKLNWIWIAPAVLISALCIFIVCILIERIRLSVFKVLRIDKLIAWLEIKIDKGINVLNEKIQILLRNILA